MNQAELQLIGPRFDCFWDTVRIPDQMMLISLGLTWTITAEKSIRFRGLEALIACQDGNPLRAFRLAIFYLN